LIDKVEDESEVGLRGGMRVFEEGGKEIDGVGIDAGAFVLGGMTDRLADVAREVV
jgi:hypothetical protein